MMRSCIAGIMLPHASPLTMQRTDFARACFARCSAESKWISPSGKRRRNTSTFVALSSSATNRPLLSKRSDKSCVKFPVPGPSSTTVSFRLKLQASATARESVAELGQIAPTLSGSRTNARTNFQARPLTVSVGVLADVSYASNVFTLQVLYLLATRQSHSNTTLSPADLRHYRLGA